PSCVAMSYDLSLSALHHLPFFIITRPPQSSTLFPYTTLFRSSRAEPGDALKSGSRGVTTGLERFSFQRILVVSQIAVSLVLLVGDRKSTRLNSSHLVISYAVFCLKKKSKL